MKYKVLLLPAFLMSLPGSIAQRKTAAHLRPRYRITIITTNGKTVKGLLEKTENSSISVLQGKWKKPAMGSSIKIDYSRIQQITLRRKNALLRGILFGTAIGMAPALVGSLFGPSTGQGGAYVSFITLPLGFITGCIIGATSRKIYRIQGKLSSFNDFRNRFK